MGKETGILSVSTLSTQIVLAKLSWNLTPLRRAFGQYGAEDVSAAYIDDFDGDCRLRRRARGWKERDLRRVSSSGCDLSAASNFPFFPSAIGPLRPNSCTSTKDGPAPTLAPRSDGSIASTMDIR